MAAGLAGPGFLFKPRLTSETFAGNFRKVGRTVRGAACGAMVLTFGVTMRGTLSGNRCWTFGATLICGRWIRGWMRRALGLRTRGAMIRLDGLGSRRMACGMRTLGPEGAAL